MQAAPISSIWWSVVHSSRKQVICQSELQSSIFKMSWQLELHWFGMEGWSGQMGHLNSGRIFPPSLGIRGFGFCILNTSVVLCVSYSKDSPDW